MSLDTDDPVIIAILSLFESVIDIAVAESTGFHGASVIGERKAEARKAFIVAMNRATQDEGP